MSEQNFYKSTIRLDKKTHNRLEQISNSTGDSMAETIRKAIEKGLALEWADENIDLIAQVVREQVEIALKPSVERICSLTSKTGHMSATSAFLNVQALMDLVPTERQKDVREMYNNAQKKAAEHMRAKPEKVKEE